VGGVIVVTGANGHLGQRLLRTLCAQQGPRADVRAVVRSEQAAQQIRVLNLGPRLEICVVDYLDAAAMALALAGASQVVHLVGILKQTPSSSYTDAHENACRGLCAAAVVAGVRRIIYLSILGSSPERANACLASKGAAERVLMEAATPALILRVPMVLGEGDYASSALKRRAGAPWNVLLRGASYEQPIYADDVVQAICSGINTSSNTESTPENKDELDNVAIDLAGPTSLSRADLTRRAAVMLDRRTRVVSVPLVLGMALVFVLERLLANPPVTRTMLKVLDHDDRIDPGPACRRLGITLTPLNTTLSKCLVEFVK
jgi:uncharacterized protein YbjT (DUF2867 family)